MQLSHAIVALLSITAAGTTAAPIRQSRSIKEASGSSLSARSDSAAVARSAEAVAAAVRSLNADATQLQPSVLAARYTKLPAIQRLRLDALDDLHRRGEIDALTNAIRSLTEDLVHAATSGAMQRRQVASSPLTGLQPVVASITCLLNTLLGIEDPICGAVSGTAKAVSSAPGEKAVNSSQTLADVLTAVAHGLEHGVAVSKNATAKLAKPSSKVNATLKANATADAAAIAASMASLPAGASTTSIIPPASLKENRAKEVDHGSRRRSLEQLEQVLRRLADTIPAAPAPVKRAAMECKTLARTAKDVDEAVTLAAGDATGAAEADDEGTASESSEAIIEPVVAAQNSSSAAAMSVPVSSSPALATGTSSAPVTVASMVGTTQVKQSAVDSQEAAVSDGSFPVATQLQAETSDDEGSAEVEAPAAAAAENLDDEVADTEAEVEPVESTSEEGEVEPVESTADEACPPPGTPNDGIWRPNCPGYGAPATPTPSPVDPDTCPPAGSVNDGIYRPNCPGYGAPIPVTSTPEPEPVDPEACPAPGTPNDGMWRPNCPGYGGRRDVSASLSRREVSLLSAITPLLNELIKDVSSYLMQPALVANATASSAPAAGATVAKVAPVARVAQPISAAKLTISTRDLLNADGFQHRIARRQAASPSSAPASVAAAPVAATSTVQPTILDNLLAGLLGSGLFKSSSAQDGTQKLDVQGLRQLVDFAMDRLGVAVGQ